MRRPTLLIAAGTTALLVALVLLWHSTLADSAAPAPTAQPRTEATNETSTPAGTSTPPAGAARPAPRPSAPGGFTPSRTVPTMPEAPAEAEQIGGPKLTNEGIEMGKNQLLEQTKAVEPLVRECVEKATASGAHATGTAILTYHVAQHGEEFTIENTGIDNEKTTLENEPLLDCLSATAKGMKFVGLPRGAKEIYAARRVTLDKGKITEYKHVTFSYLR